MEYVVLAGTKYSDNEDIREFYKLYQQFLSINDWEDIPKFINDVNPWVVETGIHDKYLLKGIPRNLFFPAQGVLCNPSLVLKTGKAIARQDPRFKDGRPKKFTPEQIDPALSLLEQGKTYRQITTMTGISKSPLIRAKNQGA